MDINEIVLQVAATLQMGYTQTALAMPTNTSTPEPTITPLPSATSQPLIIVTPALASTSTLSGPTSLPISLSTATDVGCYNSALVSETIPSGSRLHPGERFVKTWEIKNTGTCDWGRDFFFDYAGGYDFQGADRVRIAKKVTSGSTVEVSMSIDAPNDLDSYSSSWRMTNDSGVGFGQVFTIEIVVK
jgi:hypothetical protein